MPRKGLLTLEADLYVYGKKTSAEAFHEVLNALQAVKTGAQIKLKINDIAIKMEKVWPQPEEKDPSDDLELAD